MKAWHIVAQSQFSSVQASSVQIEPGASQSDSLKNALILLIQRVAKLSRLLSN
jgi:hypothetical protein